MKLRSYLVALTLAAVLPVAIFASILGAFLVEQQRETFRRGAQERTLALVTAVDAELKGSVDTLRALAEVRSLDEGNIPLFRRTAAQMLAARADWLNISMALPDGQEVINIRSPDEARLPKLAEDAKLLEQLVRTGKPIVGDLAMEPATKRWDFAVRVPVIRGGKVQYVISAVVEPESISRLIAAQDLPSGWEGMVLDRSGRIVAGTAEPEKSRGKPPTRSLRDALAQSPAGWFLGDTLEGVEAYSVYRRSETTGWTFAMAIPPSAIDSTATRAMWLSVLALVGAVALAIALARLVGRSISQPIAKLAAATDGMARGERLELTAGADIAELRSLETALRAAGRVQEALRRTEKQIRSVVDHVIDGIIAIDERGTIESFNPAAERLFGVAASEVIGQNVKTLMPDPYRSGHDAYIANYLRTGQAKIIGTGREVVGRRKDGSTFPMDLAVSEFRIGERRFFTGIVRDITDRKRAEHDLRASEERLRLAIAAGRMGNWEWNVQTGRVMWSPELEAIHGLAPGSFPGTYAAYQADIHPDDRDKVRQAIERTVKEGEDHQIEYRIVWRDGSVHWVEGRGKVDRDAGGAPVRVVGVCSDITQRKRAEEALKEADRQKDEFLAMLSHELRNPLAALTTAAHVLRAATPGDAASVGAQGVVERQTQHMVRLVDDLLDITRVRMGKISLRREVLGVAEVVGEVIQAWRVTGRLVGRASLSLEASPVWIYADRTRLEQIFANLLHNALKFTPADGHIKVSVRQEGGAAVLRITDSGRGFAPEALLRVFEPFVQGEQASERGEGGLGLGLALVRRLTELHGGSASAASDGIGRGSTFIARFPAVSPPPAWSPLLSAGPALAARPRRILLIEDNPDARQMLRAVLALAGHDVHDVPDGAAAIAAAAQARWDAAVIDIGLPDIDGYEVARRLRESEGGAGMTLVAVSGYGKEYDKGRAHGAGFDAYLMKPVSAEQLCGVIAQVGGIARTALP